MDDDAFQLNLSFNEGPKQHKLGWKERKQLQAARRKDKHSKGRGGSGAGGGGFGAVRVGAAGGAPGRPPLPGSGHSPHQQHQQQQQPQRRPGLGPAAAPNGTPGRQGQAGLPQRGAYGHAVRTGPPPPQQQEQQQQQQQGQQPHGRDRQPAERGARGRPQQQEPRPAAKRLKRDESPEWARGGEEDADLASLVALAMEREEALQRELGAAGGGGSSGGGGKGGAGPRTAGVVEFGDAEDEPDWEKAGRAAPKRPQGREGGRVGPGGKGGREDKGGKAAAPAPAARRAGGEMAHAGAPVPEAQRGAIFGDAADGDAAPSDWAGLGLCAPLADHLAALNFSEPTRVQRAALPPLLEGRDAMVRAPTGSGKTLAYLAPIVQQLQAASPRISRSEGTYALVLSPTRELAVQISDVLVALCRRFNWLVPGMLIGGEHRGHEKARLRKGVTVLVATPGRLLDHLQNTSAFRTDALAWLVLDEADRLLDMGFEAKIREITSALDARAASLEDHEGGRGSGSRPGAAGYGQHRRQTVLLSATLPPALGAFARQLMRPGAAVVGFSAAQLNEAAAASGGEGGGGEGAEGGGVAAAGACGGGGGDALPERFEVPSQLRQAFVEVPAKLRLAALITALRARLLGRGGASGGGGASGSSGKPPKAKIVVFFSNCDSVEFHHALLSQCCSGSGGGGGGGGAGDEEGEEGGGGGLAGLLPVAPLKLHGDLPQAERTSNMLRFAKADRGVLLCTDVAARGLDFPSVTAILQYDPAGEPAEYVHRVGRTARLGQAGEALLVLLPSERGYAELMGARGVELKEDSLSSLLRALPPVHSKKPWQQRAGAIDEGSPEVQALQRRLVGAVAADPELKSLAGDAFRSFLRAYAVHPSHLKPIFRVKGLHLGHIAASFALQEQPSAIGGSGAAKERKRRKAEARKEEAARGRKKMRVGAAAAVAAAR